MIVVIGGIKGGSGKTTLATNLTVLRSQERKVLLVDADEQQSASTWNQQRESQNIPTPWVTVRLDVPNIRKQIEKMAEDYDDVIIDVGGRNTSTQRSALAIADYFIVPFQPRSLDIWTLGDIKTLISELSIFNPKLKCFALINRGDSSGNDNEEALEILKECGMLTCLPFYIGQRKAFANAATDGLSIIEMKNPDKKAITEIKTLYDVIYKKHTK